MPMYDYECRKCGEVTEEFHRVWDEPVISICDCGGEVRRIIKAIQVLGDNHPVWEPYWDENLGEQPILVKSREHRRRLMKERGLEERDSVDKKRLKEKFRDLRSMRTPSDNRPTLEKRSQTL